MLFLWNSSVFSFRITCLNRYDIFLIIIMNSGAERFNGLMAMIGIIAGIGAYATTGQIIPGVF